MMEIEDLIHRLPSFAFRGTSVNAREIGRRLGVDPLLEGSIRKAAKRVRITRYRVSIGR